MLRPIALATASLCYGVCSSALAQPGPPWHLEPELRVGGANGDLNLTEISSMAIGLHGEIFVSQPQTNEILVLGDDGMELNRIGREGSGPGEFQRLTEIGVRGDTLWATDPRLSRVTMFVSGDVVETYSVVGPIINGLSSRPTAPRYVLQDGSFLGGVILSRSVGNRAVPLVRMDRNGNELGTFGTIRGPVGRHIVIQNPPLGMLLPVVVPSRSLWAAAPDGSRIVIAHRDVSARGEPANFDLEIYSPDGIRLHNRSFRYSPVRPPAKSTDSIRGALVDELRRFLPRGQAIRILDDSLDIPAFQPPVSALVIGTDNSIWLRREVLGRPQTRWMVLDPKGRIAGLIEASSELTILAADSTHVWGYELDEFDVPIAVRLRIVRR